MDIDTLIRSARGMFPDGHRLTLQNASIKINRDDGEEDVKTASVSWKIEYVPLEDFGEDALVDTSSVFTVDTEWWDEEECRCSATRIRMYSFTKEDKELLYDVGLMKTIVRKSYETQLVCES